MNHQESRDEELPVLCCGCKKMRVSGGVFVPVSVSVLKKGGAPYSHALCPDCARKLYGDENWFGEYLRGQARQSD